MFFLSESLQVELIGAEHPPLLICDEFLERARVIDQVIQVAEPLLTDAEGHFEDVGRDIRGACPLSLTHLSHEDLHIGLCLDCFELLDEVLELLLDRQVETPRIEGVNVHVIEPDQVLKVVTQTYFGGDGCCLVEVVY